MQDVFAQRQSVFKDD